MNIVLHAIVFGAGVLVSLLLFFFNRSRRVYKEIVKVGNDLVDLGDNIKKTLKTEYREHEQSLKGLTKEILSYEKNTAQFIQDSKNIIISGKNIEKRVKQATESTSLSLKQLEKYKEELRTTPDLLAQLTDLKHDAHSTLEEFSTYKTQSIEEMNNVYSRQQERMIEFEHKLKSEISDGKELLHSLETEAGLLKEKVDTELEKHSFGLTELAKEHERDFQNKIQTLVHEAHQKLYTQFENRESKISQDINDMNVRKEEIITLIDERKQQLSITEMQLEQDMLGAVEEKSKYFDEQIVKLQDEFLTKFQSLRGYAQDQSQEFKKMIDPVIQEVSHLQNEIATQYDEIHSFREQLRTQFLKDMEQNLGGIHTKYQDLEGKYKGMKLQYDEYSNAISELISSEGTHMLSEWSQTVNENKQKFTSLITSAEQEWEAFVASKGGVLYSQMEEKHDQYSGMLEKKMFEVEELFVSLDSQLGMVKKECAEINTAHTEELKHYIADFGQTFKGTVSEAEQELTSEFNKTLSELRKGIEQQIHAQATFFDEDHARVKNSLSQKLYALEEHTDKQIQDSIDNFQKEFTEKANQIEKKVVDTSRSYEQLDASISQAKQKLDGRVDHLISIIERKESELNSEIEKIKTQHSEELMRLGDNQELQEKIQKSFLQMRSQFDKLKKNVDKLSDDNIQMEKLQEGLTQSEQKVMYIKDTVKELEGNNKRVDESIRVHKKLSKKIEMLDIRSQKIDEAVKLLKDNEEAIDDLRKQLDSVRNYQISIESQYQKLEKQDKELENTHTRTEQLHHNLETLDKALVQQKQALSETGSKLKNASQEITHIEKQWDDIQEAREEIEKLTNQTPVLLSQLESMKEAQHWVASTETRLENLKDSVESSIKIFGTLTQQNKKKSSEISLKDIENQQMVLKLKDLGWSPDQIASKLKISKSAIELVLEQYLV